MVGESNKKSLYFFLVPAFCFTLIFAYLPMVGILMAFVDYNMFASPNAIVSIFTSPFVGLDNFKVTLTDPYFWQVFRNTIAISFSKILICFPLPIILAIAINEVIWPRAKKIIQTIVYLPHFLSWVIVSGIWIGILGGAGVINDFLINHEVITQPIPFLTNDYLFRIVILITDAWKETGWSAIIYLAAITAIDYELYEAIRIDGGNKFREIIHVTLPGIASTIAMMLILRVSGVMDAGFDQIFNMYSPYVYEMNDIIGTYVYRLGIGAMEYSLSTAISLFNSIIGITLFVSANYFVKKLTNKSIW